MNKVVISLEENDLLYLHEVIVDRDKEKALDFLKTRIIPKIPTKGTAPCDSSRLNPYLSGPARGILDKGSTFTRLSSLHQPSEGAR